MAEFVSCTSSSSSSRSSCENIYVGDSELGWETASSDNLPWIEINLSQEYDIYQLRILQPKFERYNKVKMENVEIVFSDGTAVEQRLTNRAVWNIINLTNLVRSKFVRIIRQENWRYSDAPTGIVRIQAFTCNSGDIIFHTYF